MAELRATMGQAEFVAWSVYHGRRAQRMELERLKAERKG